MTDFNVQKFVNEIFDEDRIYRSCVQNILNNLDNQLERSGNDRERISRLLMIRNYIETEIPVARSAAFEHYCVYPKQEVFTLKYC